MSKGINNFQIDRSFKEEDNEELKKLYGNFFHRFNN